MSFVASLFNWVPVVRNTRVSIAAGPLLHGAPVQWVVFGHAGAGNIPVNFTITVYSASPPWYLVSSGSGIVWPFDMSTSPPSVDGAPWQKGFPIWMAASPWVQVFVTTDVNCSAHLYVL